MISRAEAVIGVALLALLISGCCGGKRAVDSGETPAGTLELALRSSLEGVRYQLEASFAVSGVEAVSLTARPGESTITQELSAGGYAVELQPGYRVFQDQAVVLTPIAAELVSDATQAFEITADVTTRVSYHFTVAAGTLEFGSDEP
jgi:hypothetical protein